jgi:hypothetical protein
MGGLHVLYSRRRYERIPKQEADKEQKSAETIVPRMFVERRKEGRVESLEQGNNRTGSKRHKCVNAERT